jgi:hypothetical protein
MQHNQKSRLWQAIYPLLAPVLIGIYPTLFYYASNVEIVLISSLIRTTFLYFCISLAIYSFFLVFSNLTELEQQLSLVYTYSCLTFMEFSMAFY